MGRKFMLQLIVVFIDDAVVQCECPLCLAPICFNCYLL